MKKVLSIAGSDCSGGAGIQADLKTFSAYGVFGMSVIVSVVAENTSRVIGIQNVTPDMIEKQIDAVFEDIEVDAVKIGMLSCPESMEAVAGRLLRYAPPNVIIDPVMYAKNGSPLMEPSAIDTLIRTVIPLGDLITPNIPEAEAIAGMKITNPGDMEKAAKLIYQMGCRGVLIKGGHAADNIREGHDADNIRGGHAADNIRGGHAADNIREGHAADNIREGHAADNAENPCDTGQFASEKAVDILYDGREFCHYSAERIDTRNTHGTGCTFSSAIAAGLALGLDLREAVHRAKEYVTTAIRHALPIGRGNGPTHHFYDLYKYGLRSATDQR